MGDLVELLTVTDHFQLDQVGLVVAPDFVPPVGWETCSETVVVVTPDGRLQEATACLAVWHFKMQDPAEADKQWRLVVSFPSMGKSEIPIGSKVMVKKRLQAAIEQATIST